VSTTRRAAGSGVARIGVAIGIGSLAGFALLALVGRALRPAEFGLFVAFWGVLFGVGSSLSTIEQETARHAARGTDHSPGPAASAVTTAAAMLAGLAAATTLLPPVAERLYGRADSRLGLIVVIAAFGFAVQFAVRGQLIGSGAVRRYARIVVAEAAARLVVLLAVLVLVGVDLVTAAVAVAAGSFAWLAWPGHARDVLPDRGLSPADWRAATGRAGSLMAGAALTASVITGFPTLVTALTGEAPGTAGGVVFAALTVSRVPLLLVSPVQALAVPFVVRAHDRAGADGASEVRRALLLGSLLFAVLGAVAAAAAWMGGPWVVRLLYGNEYDVSAVAFALLVFSACLLAWVQLLSAALIALAAHRRMLMTWVIAVVSTAAWLVASPLDVVATTAVGSLVGPLAALAYAVPSIWKLAGRDSSHR
jgi:O-antigen/teichoic acid export membrane protein